MAVPAHRLTGAQVCAGQATQPALVWTSDPTGDWLASNGVPGWYDPDGASHQAQAHTWRHPPSGANGSPGQPDPAAGFLPPTHHDATPPWRCCGRTTTACRSGGSRSTGCTRTTKAATRSVPSSGAGRQSTEPATAGHRGWACGLVTCKRQDRVADIPTNAVSTPRPAPP